MANKYWLVGTWLMLCLASVNSVDVTSLIPETLQDGENFADKDSNITYKKIKDEYAYRAAQSVDIGPLETLYDLARSIISTSLPGDFPIDWAVKIKDGKLVIGDDWQPLVKDYLGYVIAIAVGLLFIILCPIIGFCFCCCRCCGHCGGGRYIKNPDDAGFEQVCARRVSIIILTVITVMALTGSALMFATNEKVSDSLQRIKDQDVDKLDDVTAFFDSVIDQTSILVNENFNFTWSVLTRDLDNIGYLLGQPIKDDVILKSGLQATYDGIDSMEGDAKKLNDSLKILNEEKVKLLSAGPYFDKFIQDLQIRIDDVKSKETGASTMASDCPHYNLSVLSFNVDQLPNEINKSVALSIFLQAGISALTKKSRDDLNAIPERIQNETQSKREDVKNQAGNYTKKVKEITDNLQKIRDDFLADLDFDGFKKNAKDFMDYGIKYDKYRWYGGLGLACITLLISLLLGLGLLCGLFGGNAFVDPTERSSISNHGGNLLTSAIMLFFIFAWLIMLVTTVLFVAGAPTEKFGCRTLNDLPMLEEVVTDLKFVSGKSWLGELIYPGKGVNLSISEVLMACKAGKAAYTALKMEESNIFNLSQITDYSQSINFGDQISQFKVDFGGLNITSGPMIDFIDFMSTFEDNMNYTGYKDTLNDNKVNQSNTFIQELSNYLSNTTSFQTSNLTSIQTDLKNELTNGNGSIALISIKRTLQALEAIKNITQLPTNNTLKTRSSNLKSNLSQIESQLPKITNDTFRNSISNFESRLRKIFDKFTSDIKQKVENDLGKCTPLWNLYNSLLKESICKSTLGAVNGWWCALGWTIFFLLLSTCTSVVASKHFFRMKYISEPPSKPPLDTHEKEKVHHFKNQVFHTDTNTDKW